MINTFESPRQPYTKPANGAEYNMATIFIRRRPDSVMEWAIEDVLDWLKELELERFCKRFQSKIIALKIVLTTWFHGDM
jgi:phage host-nuclease inhibitor protein Gam